MRNPAEIALRKKILGVLLRHARLRANLTLKDVAQITDFPAGALSDYEYGRRDLSLPHLEVLAHVYRVPVSYFWSDNPFPEDDDRSLRVAEAVVLRQRIVGVLLRQARQDAGYTQAELAEVLECAPTRIANFEMGRTEIPLSELETLAEFLGLSVDYFFDEGIKPQDQKIASIDEMTKLSDLPQEARRFLAHPGNILYIRVAMQLSKLPASTLRSLGEGILDITY
jgi:transcriptional regulator with XRE-family HTH domain